MATNNGKKGGLLKGKLHYDKNGVPLGGIKGIVTDTNQPVELEGGEVIINKEASKKHWKELSKINQSAGNGVPILPPDEVDTNSDEYGKGGNTKIIFNPNHIPNKWVYEYAKKIKDNFPKVWDLGGNQFGNQAFENLENVIKRGYWTENEEWMYIKWQSFNARHSNDYLIAGVIANLKWLNKVNKGWNYMKDLIEDKINDIYNEQLEYGGELKKGIEVEKEHLDTFEKLYNRDITPEQAPKYVTLEHLKHESPNYYSKLESIEKQFDLGGGINDKIYTYAQILRPFDTGTYPKENFIRFVQDDTYNHGGYLEYSKPLSIELMDGYDLAPISEIWKYNNKEYYYHDKHKVTVTIIENSPLLNNIYKNIPAVQLEYYNENKIVDKETMRGLQFMKKIEDGKFIEVTTNENDQAPEKEEVPKFDFMKSNLMGQARAITVLEKRINADGKIKPYYEWIESFEKGLVVETTKLYSSKSEKGYTEKPVVGDHIVHSKAEQDYYVYLENGGEPYSNFLKRKKIYDDIIAVKTKIENEQYIAEKEKKQKELEDAQLKAKNEQIKSLIENGYEFVLDKRLAWSYNRIAELKAQRKSADRDNQIAFEERMILQYTEQIKNNFKVATELYEVINDKVVKKYNWKVGDRVLYNVGINPISTEIEQIIENGLEKDAHYKVKKVDGISNQYITYEGLLPIAPEKEVEPLESIENEGLPLNKESKSFNEVNQGDNVQVYAYQSKNAGATYDGYIKVAEGLVTFKYGRHYLNIGNDKTKYDKGNIYYMNQSEQPKEKTFKERINVEKNAENYKDIRQSLDEFFTPKWTAEIMFDLAIKHGFMGGSVLEPSFGHGVFFDVAIENSNKTKIGIKEDNLYGFEIYKPNFDLVKKKYPKANLYDHNFEYQFIKQDIFFRKNNIQKSSMFNSKSFDLVIGNPPYGTHKSPHAFYFDKKMQIRYEGFFIWLALQKVKQGGLVIFIINSLWLQNGNLYNYQKEQIGKIGELIDAYRLPNKTFKDTDIATDIVVFRKK